MRVKFCPALSGEHIGGHDPDCRPQFETVPTEPSTNEETAAGWELIHHRMPVGRNRIESGVSPGTLAQFHGRIAADESLTDIQHKIGTDLFVVMVRVDKGIGFSGVN